jgi:hypothetical protein
MVVNLSLGGHFVIVASPLPCIVLSVFEVDTCYARIRVLLCGTVTQRHPINCGLGATCYLGSTQIWRIRVVRGSLPRLVPLPKGRPVFPGGCHCKLIFLMVLVGLLPFREGV